jgi:hypothetical protein
MTLTIHYDIVDFRFQGLNLRDTKQFLHNYFSDFNLKLVNLLINTKHTTMIDTMTKNGIC